MVFVSSPLNDDNYLVWNRAMKFALGSRMKLSFIDGRSVWPPEGSPELDEWIRKDYLVITWILNNVSKSIVDAFMYVTSARCLWKLWDELACLDPLPVCTCTAHRGMVAREASHQLMQFLMGLSSHFANVRSQILVMDPRPDVAKVFSMLLNVEKELQVQIHLHEHSKALAFKLEHKEEQSTVPSLHHFKARTFVDKRTLFCDHCQKNGHTKETCFKIHGTPDWYKDLADKKRKGTGGGRGSFAGAVSDGSIQLMKLTDANLSEILRSELKKLLKEENTSVERSHIHLIWCISTLLRLKNLQDLKTKDKLAVGKLVGKLPLTAFTPSSTLLPHNLAANHMKVFGCLCYATNTNPHKTKFYPRASKCLFLGYAPNQKGYKVYDLLSNSYFVSRDVIFYEPSLPFSSGDPALRPYCPIPLVPHSATDTCAPTVPSLPAPVLPQPTSDSLPNIFPVSPNGSTPDPSTLETTPTVPKRSNGESQSYKKAAASNEWREAMNDEIKTLERNQTWEVTTLPPAKGYTQVEGVDYVKSFSPVAKAVTVRLLLAVAAARGWEIHQLDVNNASSMGIWMKKFLCIHHKVTKLLLVLYAVLLVHFMALSRRRQWNQEFTSQLQHFGFAQSCHDHCLFTKGSDQDFTALLVYVDDVLVVSPSLFLIHFVKEYLHALFTIKDLDIARYFLGSQIARSDAGISLTQSKYILDILTDTGLSSAISVTTPLPQGVKLCSDAGSLLPDPGPYRMLIGHLLYLGFTRPDISYGVQQLSQFLLHPCAGHWAAALHLVKRSISGFCVFLGPALISWKSKKQNIVSRSSAEAEYQSLAARMCELQWVSYILPTFGVSASLPISLYCDNKAALHIMENPVFHERTKHLDIDCHMVRNQYRAGFVLPSFVRNGPLFSISWSILGGGDVGIVAAAMAVLDLGDVDGLGEDDEADSSSTFTDMPHDLASHKDAG
ncbi:UNVERIFIED_CONTAM: Retrovirus-related Pol polyprotein from transposon RE2 [Sesamum latifolium]|uniref:Retrovirus-related Pol polyprotein from transposon RE2 n=1 Tax=Sesamum latifolium TaxID=2727402 RepID=A0AAW2XWF1_9LAMI